MIVADNKPLEEIIESIEGYQRILVAGCNECVTVCETGGKKEVGVLAAALRLHFLNKGEEVKVEEITLQRQCDREYLQEAAREVDRSQVVVSLACGVGCQFMAEEYPKKPVMPGVNTMFMGAKEDRGVFKERCQACGSCILARTGSICPVSRCAKRLLNGPCGGSTKGKCEIDPNLDCAWQLIIDRLKALDQMDSYEEVTPLKDWSTDRAGGPRTMIHEEAAL